MSADSVAASTSYTKVRRTLKRLSKLDFTSDHIFNSPSGRIPTQIEQKSEMHSDEIEHSRKIEYNTGTDAYP